MKKLLLGIIFVLGGIASNAQTSICNCHTHISKVRSVNSIKLTTKLICQRKRMHLQKKMTKADGVITRKEKARIKYTKSKMIVNIYREKHNLFK